MNYGALVGIVLIIITLIVYVLDMDGTSMVLGILNYAVLIGGIFLGTKYLRDKTQNGAISYGRCLGSGTLIGLFSSILVALYTFIFYKFIDPDALEKIFIMMEDQYLQSGLSEEQVEMSVNMMRKFTTPGMMALNTIMGSTFMAFLFSLIIGAFVKKKPVAGFSAYQGSEIQDVEEVSDSNEEK